METSYGLFTRNRASQAAEFLPMPDLAAARAEFWARNRRLRLGGFAAVVHCRTGIGDGELGMVTNCSNAVMVEIRRLWAEFQAQAAGAAEVA